MKFLTTAYYEFKKNVRDIKMAAILLLFPIITIYILGNAVGSFFTNDIEEKIPIGLFIENDSPLGAELQHFLRNDDLKSRIDLKLYNGLELGEANIQNGYLHVFIHVKEETIFLVGKKNVEFIESLMVSFVTSYNSVQALIQAKADIILPEKNGSLNRIYHTEDFVPPKIIDYYSVLTLLQVLIIGALHGVYIVSQTPNSDMHIRLNSLPVHKWTILLGRSIGSVVYLFLASVIVIMFTKFVYNANWGGNALIIASTFFIFCFLAVGLGLIIGTLVKNTSVSLLIVLLFMMFFGTVSGAISPVAVSDIFSFLSPNHHAKQLLFGTIYNYPSSIKLQAAFSLATYVVIIYSLLAILIWKEDKE